MCYCVNAYKYTPNQPEAAHFRLIGYEYSSQVLATMC